MRGVEIEPVSYDWLTFLTDISRRLLDTADEHDFDLLATCEDDYEAVLASRWLGFPGATVDQIAQLEAHLGMNLPPDYKQFLLVTNGWRDFCFYPYDLISLLPVAEVGWFAQKDERIGRLESWLRLQRDHQLPEGYVYVSEEHFRGAILIGESDGNECLLLNPFIRDRNGAWEAWLFTKYDGVLRFSSFWRCMNELRRFFEGDIPDYY